jgi:hypothetical protein
LLLQVQSCEKHIPNQTLKRTKTEITTVSKKARTSGFEDAHKVDPGMKSQPGSCSLSSKTNTYDAGVMQEVLHDAETVLRVDPDQKVQPETSCLQDKTNEDDTVGLQMVLHANNLHQEEDIEPALEAIMPAAEHPLHRDVLLSQDTPPSQTRRLSTILSVPSTQRACFICKAQGGRKRIPSDALFQVWITKDIVIPHENRCCANHLTGKTFTDDALNLITGTQRGVLMTDDNLVEWILQLSEHVKNKSQKRRRYDFDDESSVPELSFKNIVGFVKEDFDYLVSRVQGYMHNSVNRSTRNAVAMLLMLLRHDLSQVGLENTIFCMHFCIHNYIF